MGTIGRRGYKRPKQEFTEDAIQQVLAKEYMTNPKYVAYNLHIFPWESDFLICTRAGYWYEVEIKISLADFKNDQKHKTDKYHVLENGTWHCGVGECHWLDDRPVWSKFEETPCHRPNYFSYCVPYALVEKVKPLLPPFAGLCYVDERGKLQHERCAQQLHKQKYTAEELKLTEKFYYAYLNWRDKSKSWRQRERDLRAELSWVKTEYELVAGYPVEDNL